MLNVEELINVINYEISAKGRQQRRKSNKTTSKQSAIVCSLGSPPSLTRQRQRPRQQNHHHHHHDDNSSIKRLHHHQHHNTKPLMFKKLASSSLPDSDQQDDDEGDDDDDGGDEDDDDDDDGCCEGGGGVGGGGGGKEVGERVGGGAMFDTSIVRVEVPGEDPSLFTLPPVFDKAQIQKHQGDIRVYQNGRLLPVISENTFLTTNKRGQGHDPDLRTSVAFDGDDDLRLPGISNQRASLALGQRGEGEGRRTRKGRESKAKGHHSRKNAEREKRVAGNVKVGGVEIESSLVEGLDRLSSDLSREKTDPPPQPIIVSIRTQDGEILHRTPLEKLPPGTFTTLSSNPKKKSSEKMENSRRELKQPATNTGAMSLSRETTLDSPDYFLSRLRAASWCECGDHVTDESRCGECRKVAGHEKWCVTRNSVCQTCGKAFKRKYSHLERKSSFGVIPVSERILARAQINSKSSVMFNYHQSSQLTLAKSDSHPPTKEPDTEIPRETSVNRVRFQEDGKIVYPEREIFNDRENKNKHKSKSENQSQESKPSQEREPSTKKLKSFLPSIYANVHKRAYEMALADAKLKQIFRKKKPSPLQETKRVCFSYFPLLRRKRSPVSDPDLIQNLSSSKETFGLRPDSKEGRKLRVKRGLKHVLGKVNLADYYPGGKRYPSYLDKPPRRSVKVKEK